MNTYNYNEEMVNDIIAYIKDEEIDWRNLTDEELFDILWIADRVTGNASGSYWFSTWKAEEALCHNWDLAIEAIEAFGDRTIDIEDWRPEKIDVTIRCMMLLDRIAAAREILEYEENLPY